MHLYLTRQRNGDYMLTRMKPQIEPVLGLGESDAYIRAGDPIGYRHMCAGGTVALFGRHLAPLETVEVDVRIEPRIRRGVV